MRTFEKSKIYGLLALLISAAALMVACDRAKFTHNSALPEPAAQEETTGDGLGDGLDGGSEDTVVQCQRTDGNICLNKGVKSIPVNGTFYLPLATSTKALAANQKFPGTKCYRNTFDQTKRKNAKVNGVELWLIVDSSNSFDKERVAVAQAILEGYLENCTLGVPVRISVIAAHTPESIDSSARGEVFFSQEGEPLTVTLYPGMSEKEFRKAQSDLLVKLDKGMRRDPLSENYGSPIGHSGADELGLLALNNALKRAPKRQDHALTVIFMSDENDICMGAFNGDPDGHEKAMHDLYCKGISPEGVYTALREYAGDRPTILASVVYSGMRPVVNEAPNGIGRGYLDLVEMAGGRSIELSPTSGATRAEYITGMAADLAIVAGQMTTRFTKYYPHYPVYNMRKKSIPLSQVRVIPETQLLDLRVTVDGQGAEYSVDPRYNLVTPDRSGNQVVIEYCQ